MTRPWTTHWAALIALTAVSCGGQMTDDLAGDGAAGVGAADAGGTGGATSGAGGRSLSTGGTPATGGVMSGGGASGGSGGGEEPFGGGAGGRPEDCPEVSNVPGTAALYDRTAAGQASATADFFRFPWPELSRGSSELSGFPNPPEATGCEPKVSSGLAGLLVDAIDSFDYRDYVINLAREHLTEGSQRPNVFIAFDGPLSSSRLPSAADTLSPNAGVFMMNVDPGSPALGSLVPLRLRLYENSRYLPPNTLAAAPEPGFPLDPGTRYALVVRRGLQDREGAELGSSAAFEARKVPCDGGTDEYPSVFDVLSEVARVPPSDVAAMTVFDTGHPIAGFDDVAKAVAFDEGVSPGALSPQGPATDLSTTAGYHLVSGTLSTPFFQRGTPPYLPKMSGMLTGLSVELDAKSTAGDFEPATSATRWESVDFALSLPSSALDAESVELPVVIYGPGTGGSKTSPMDLGIAGVLAELGFAVLSTTPVLHATRAHSDNLDPDFLAQIQQLDGLIGTNYAGELIATVESGSLFFNPLNLAAARGNAMQAAVDFLWQARLLASTSVQVEVSGQTKEIAFDREQIYFFGHSQGAGAGPLLAASPHLRGALLSGASGHIPALVLDKTKPADQVDISGMIDYIVCDSSAEPLDFTHPFMGLLGHWLEPSDAELHAKDFLFGSLPKSVFVLVGRDDAYAPPISNDAITTALGLNESTPRTGFSARDVLGQDLLAIVRPGFGYGETKAGISANISGKTGVFKQYHDQGCEDDHFTYVCDSSAVTDWLAYLATGLDGSPTVP